jgi:cytochrome c biogenesis protein CcmG/thiol:disulfide interchange protein DsbE
MGTHANRARNVALTACAALVLAACGSGGGDVGSKPPDYDAALKRSPPRLAALHAQANDLLPGGPDAFERALAKLRGYPVVVNKWGSWCGPCRIEFPWYQDLSAKYGKRVAFLGVDGNDSDAAARTFLEEDPVSYPSYTDPNLEISDTVLGVRNEFPATAFFDTQGNRVDVHIGQYASKAELEADIRRYAG